MNVLFKTLVGAGMIASFGLLAAPASAQTAQDAGSLLAQLKESGAPTSYVRGRGFHGGFRGGHGFGHRGFGHRGFGHRGFGHRGFAGRGFGRRGFGRPGFAGRGFYGRRGYGYGYGYRRRGFGGGALLGGLAAGALVGGALAAQAAPGPVYAGPGGNAVAYCQQKFKSYNPATGTYLGYDGQRHSCP